MLENLLILLKNITSVNEKKKCFLSLSFDRRNYILTCKKLCLHGKNQQKQRTKIWEKCVSLVTGEDWQRVLTCWQWSGTLENDQNETGHFN